MKLYAILALYAAPPRGAWYYKTARWQHQPLVIFFATIEIVAMLFIIWYAWTWTSAA
jgi:hypothetical protein